MTSHIYRLLTFALAAYIGMGIGLYFRVPALIQDRLVQTSQTR